MIKLNERRFQTRVVVKDCFARVSDTSASGLTTVYPVHDLCLDGLRLCSDGYLWPGTRLTLRLVDQKSHRAEEVEGIVRWSATFNGHGKYHVGVEITKHRAQSWDLIESMVERARRNRHS